MIDARDTALILEGGGTRNSYTAPGVIKLLEHEVRFGWVGGVSAGSVHALNYASRDIERSRRSFTEFVGHPEFGGWRSFVRGRGYINGEFIYEGSSEALPFDYDTYLSTEEEVHVEATRADSGETVVWNRADMATIDDINRATRASSTLPLIMQMPLIGDAPYVDGALGDSGGILIDAARRAGFTRFFFLATKPRDYVRPEVTRPRVTRRMFRKNPAVAESIISRPARYNASKQTLLDLEAAGQAQLFFPDSMQVEATELNVAKLKENYVAGEAQVEREWPQWERFLRGA
ncbi:Patatin-like phospholipase [Corynebacterium capitovis DSM 44611]|uniref:patatin-like phospholipase family protein n=1 Tax=Corynebacterium capitovis TaxID=131081 RepID=UPI000374C995|nr:patatin family protein [Corynebacterium capitovis]WKD57993.1 Patatin-like phospholipase [Corynebacterium capitovis DSM 44611]